MASWEAFLRQVGVVPKKKKKRVQWCVDGKASARNCISVWCLCKRLAGEKKRHVLASFPCLRFLRCFQCHIEICLHRLHQERNPAEGLACQHKIGLQSTHIPAHPRHSLKTKFLRNVTTARVTSRRQIPRADVAQGPTHRHAGAFRPN